MLNENQKILGWIVGFEPTLSGATNQRFNQLSYTHHMARQKGLEPLTYCLEGSCSIQLSYWRKNEIEFGAGDGNRTHTPSLEGWGSTTELHPRIVTNSILSHHPLNVNRKFKIFSIF